MLTFQTRWEMEMEVASREWLGTSYVIDEQIYASAFVIRGGEQATTRFGLY